MVLYNALNESLNATLLKGDDGKYLEERMLINQFFKINKLSIISKLSNIDIDSYYEMLLPSNNLSNEEKEAINNKLWIKLKSNLYDIYQDEKMINDFGMLFEAKSNISMPGNRIAEMQDMLSMFFIELLKSSVLDGMITKEEALRMIKEYEDDLIKPGDARLDVPENNIGLDESINFFNTKKNEYQSIANENNVK